MNDYLLYILIGLVIILLIIIFLMHKKNQQSAPPAAVPLPEEPKAVEEKTSIPPAAPNEDRLEVVKNYIEQKRYDDASALLNEGLAAEPHNDKYKLQLLNIYAQTGQYEQFDNMYQTLQTQADMVTLQQAKEIKQQYADHFPQEVADDTFDSTDDTLSSQNISSDSSPTIEDDLSFAFENELSLDDEVTEEKSADNDLTFAIDAEDELTLSSESPASSEADEQLSTLDKDADSADEDLFTFDELESQLLTAETEDNVETSAEPKDIDSESGIDSEGIEDELTSDFDLNEDFITEEASIEETSNDLNLESIDSNEISFDDEDLLELSEVNEEAADTTSSVDTPETSEPAFDFDLDLSDEVSESSETSASQPVEQDLTSEDTIDFLDDVEQSTDEQASTADIAPSKDEANESFEFELDDLDGLDNLDNNEVELKTVKESSQPEDLDEFDFDLTEIDQKDADDIQIENTVDEDISLDWSEPLAETPVASQSAEQTDLQEDLVTEETIAADEPVASELPTTEEQVFDFESDSIESDSIVSEELPTDSQPTSKDEATQVSPTTTEATTLEEDEDLIFNEGVADTISQLDALDFDFDADYEDDFEQPVESPTDASKNVDLVDSATSSQAPVTTPSQEHITDKVSQQQPVETDTLAAETKEAAPAPATKIDKEFGQAFDFVEQLDKSQITLDLAEQYLDLGEYDSAKRLVNEVLTSATNEQHKAHAQALLERMH